MATMVWVIVTWLAIGAGILCSLAVLGVGVLTVTALVLGAEWDEHEDPTDEACEGRIEECRQMALGLFKTASHEVHDEG